MIGTLYIGSPDFDFGQLKSEFLTKDNYARAITAPTIRKRDN